MGDIIRFYYADVPIEAIVAMPDEADLNILAEEIEEPLPETKSDDKMRQKDAKLSPRVMMVKAAK